MKFKVLKSYVASSAILLTVSNLLGMINFNGVLKFPLMLMIFVTFQNFRHSECSTDPTIVYNAVKNKLGSPVNCIDIVKSQYRSRITLG